jgi:hypothetical protein
MDFETEVPKYKKKKVKKTPKKADHKHEYVPVKIRDNPLQYYRRYINDATKRFWVMYTAKCTTCGKEVWESTHLTEEEYHKFVEEVRKNNGYEGDSSEDSSEK